MKSFNQKVRFITRKWPPSMGGMETYSYCLAKALEKKVQVEVIKLEGRKNGKANTGFPLIMFGLSTFFSLFFKRSTTITHLGDMAIWPLALPLLFTGKLSNLVISAHGTDISYANRSNVKGRLYKAYINAGQKILSNAVIIANSNATESLLQQHKFNKTCTIPLGCEHPSVIKLDTPPLHPTVLFAGRMIKQKGLDWFIRLVLPKLPETTRVRVAGTVLDPELLHILKHEQVDFLGQLAYPELLTEYENASCVIVPNTNTSVSYFEGFGLVAAEASIAGGVVVAARHTGLIDAVVDNVTGFLLSPCNTVEWVNKINDILNWNDEERTLFLEKSIQHSRSYFSWERVAEDTLAVYEKMVKQ